MKFVMVFALKEVVVHLLVLIVQVTTTVVHFSAIRIQIHVLAGVILTATMIIQGRQIHA